MAKYKVEVTETLQKIVEVEADDKEQAESIARQMYRKEEIVLDEGNLTYVDFNAERIL